MKIHLSFHNGVITLVNWFNLGKRNRSKFARFLDKHGITQQDVANKAGVSKSTNRRKQTTVIIGVYRVLGGVEFLIFPRLKDVSTRLLDALKRVCHTSTPLIRATACNNGANISSVSIAGLRWLVGWLALVSAVKSYQIKPVG